MTDYSYAFIAKWRDWQMPPAKADGCAVVSYDQGNLAFEIDAEDHDAFVEWVAQNWETDRAPRFMDDETTEPAADYLDRVGVNVRFA